MQPYGQNDACSSFEAHWMSSRFKELENSHPFLPPLSVVGHDAYCLGDSRSQVPREIYRRQKRTFRRALVVNRGSTARDRRWYNPNRRCLPKLDRRWVESEKPSSLLLNRGSAARDRRWYNPDRRCFPKLDRRWVESEKYSSMLESGEDKFILMSYNILGVSNSSEHPDLYVNVPFDAIQWESRKQLVCEDIRRSNADIVCLQEVDRYYDFESDLNREGYIGRYKARTGAAKDGCSLFWKNERFHLLEEHAIEFNAFGLRDNVAQVVVFETAKHQNVSRRIVIANIHVLFNPRRGDIKLGQVRILLQKAQMLSVKWGGLPVVIAGDFNSTPQSAIYEFLSTSELNLTKHDRKCLSGQERFQATNHGLSGMVNSSWTDEELKNATGYSSCNLLSHPLKLSSSYARIKGKGRTRSSCGEPLATTYHSKFMGTVDYLWYSEELEPARVLDTLPIAALKSIGGLPSKDIGSDHLHLVAEFVFAPRPTEQNYQGKEPKMKKFRKCSSNQTGNNTQVLQ